jgi:hypothetical protein
MNKKTRTIIFLFCFILFAIGGPSVILYSQGYRININAKEGEKILTSTGGIFVKTLPKQVDVYLNGKLAEKTDFLFGSVLLENLLPGKYDVEISKEGYATWKKTLIVKEREVTEAKGIVLFPSEIGFNLISKDAQRIWATPDQRIIIRKETSDGWILNLYDPRLETEINLLKEKDIYSKGVELKGITFSTTSQDVILNTMILDKERYFSFNLNDVKGTIENIEKPAVSPEEHIYGNYAFRYDNETLSFEDADSKTQEIADSVKGIRFSPDGRKLLFFTNNEISVFFLENAIVPRKDAGDVMTLMVSQDAIEDCLWLNSDYIAIATENEILISELDNRDSLQQLTLVTTKNPEIIWSDATKRLYYTNKEGLLASDLLLP